MARENRLDQEKWFNRAALVAEFARRRRRLPTPSDGQIGQWLSGQRSALHAGSTSMTAERQIFLDSLAPGWRVFLPSPTWTWPERAEQLFLFRTVEKRWPSQAAGDEVERGLGNWLSMQRTKAHRSDLSDAQRAVLDRYVPGWDPGSREVAWCGNADALGAFAREHGRWPSKGASSREERRLGSWLHNRRQDARTGAGLKRARAVYLDQVAPGWNR